jgi:hypothetical protein
MSIICLLLTPKAALTRAGVVAALTTATKLGRGVDFATESMLKIIELLPETLIEYFVSVGLYRPRLTELSRSFTDSLATCVACYKVMRERSGDICGETAFVDRYLRAWEVVEDSWADEVSKLELRSAGRLYVTYYLREFQKDIKILFDARQSTKRLAPIGLYFYGAVGIGKSFFVEPLVQSLFPDIDPAQVAYSKSATDKFCSGYRNQPARH